MSRSPVDAEAAFARDLAAVCRVYRLALQARAMEYACRRHGLMAELLAAGSEVAGEVADGYAERALWLSMREGRA